MKAEKHLEFRLCQGKSEFMLALMDRILNIKRILLTTAASAGMTVVLALTWGSNEAATPLVIFSGLITLLFLALFLYMYSTKPKIRRQISFDAESGGTIVFDESGFDLTIGHNAYPKMSFRDIRGQYWAGDYFVLHVDHADYKSLLCIAVDAVNFDALYALAQRLVSRKVKLVQVKMIEKRKGYERKDII